MNLRLVTWNLDRSHATAKWRIDEQRRTLEAQNADVYLLTEVDERFEIFGLSGTSFSDSGAGRYAATEHAAGIWTRLPMRRARTTRDSRHVACATFDSALGPIALYSTIIPWHAARHEPGDRQWTAHRRSLAAQIEDWTELRRRLPDHHLLIAGDFNMALGTSSYYGDVESREKLRRACADLGLKCLTDLDLPSVREGGKDNIDHIIVSDRLTAPAPPRLWMPQAARGCRHAYLSDHCGVTVDLAVGG